MWDIILFKRVLLKKKIKKEKNNVKFQYTQKNELKTS